MVREGDVGVGICVFGVMCGPVMLIRTWFTFFFSFPHHLSTTPRVLFTFFPFFPPQYRSVCSQFTFSFPLPLDAARDNISSVVEVRQRPIDAIWRYHLDVIVDGQRVYFDRYSQKIQQFRGENMCTTCPPSFLTFFPSFRTSFLLPFDLCTSGRYTILEMRVQPPVLRSSLTPLPLSTPIKSYATPTFLYPYVYSLPHTYTYTLKVWLH